MILMITVFVSSVCGFLLLFYLGLCCFFGGFASGIYYSHVYTGA